ncbi:hypothetical protein [Natrononativus amylolyticus]|uniref:hypothetical protein n=1 Tax=Natrononativus amylolyticus TaxID=2963434 RepID=UPI0020CFA595|nr:hypothetical protein [Natrononativus amylolyticus]
MGNEPSADKTEASESDRSLILKALLRVFSVRINGCSRFRNGTYLEQSVYERIGDRLAPLTKGFLVIAIAVTAASQSASAQYCNDGIGLLIADTQIMLWQFVVGLLVVIALLGLVLRAFPLFAGATAMGNLMIVGVIVGVIGFVFILTFIDVAFDYVSGPGVGEGCSPFL